MTGDGVTERQRHAMAAAMGELRAWIALLEMAQQALRRCAETIEPAPSEADPEVDLDRMDLPTEVRSVLRNVVEDCLRPAVADLRALLSKETHPLGSIPP